MLTSPFLRAEAIIVTEAMHAMTIAEIFITKQSIVVELEIGVRNYKAFRNALPDTDYQVLEKEAKPLRERLPQFFLEDWILRSDGGEPLIGKIEHVSKRQRVRRDKITLEPLATYGGKGEEALFIKISYPLDGRPGTLSITPPHCVGSHDGSPQK